LKRFLIQQDVLISLRSAWQLLRSHKQVNYFVERMFLLVAVGLLRLPPKTCALRVFNLVSDFLHPVTVEHFLLN
jgi:hypothetical protein